MSKLQNETLGDFTTTPRVIPISALAMVIGVVCAFVALALLRLIGLFTNLFYFGRWSTSLVSPAGNHLGLSSRAGASRGRADHRRDGAIRIGANSRSRHSRKLLKPFCSTEAGSSRRWLCSSRFRRRFPSARAVRSARRARSS